jgi:hypothetical protein
MLQTVPFYTGEGALRHDLVITALNRGGVAGYLIFPSKGESAAHRLAGGRQMAASGVAGER